jgi:hypothetical protein
MSGNDMDNIAGIGWFWIGVSGLVGIFLLFVLLFWLNEEWRYWQIDPVLGIS